MSTANTPQKVPRSRVVIDAGRLWGGGVATATEVSTIAVLYALLVGTWLYGGRDARTVYRMLVDAAALSGAILLILGTALYAGIRLVPVYLEYTKVARSLEQVRDEHAAIDTNPQLIRNSLERRWDVEDIKSIGWKEVVIKKSNDGYDVMAVYNVEQPFVANVYLLVKFDKSVVIQQ